MKAFKFIAILLSLGIADHALADPKVRIRINFKEAGLSKPKIPGNVDIGGQDIQSGTVDLIGSMDYFKLLKAEGFPVELVETQTQVDPRYLKPDGILTVLKQLSETYPKLMHIEEIGKTLRGRPILAVRLTTPDHIEKKPAVLFNAMHHAREVMTAEVAIDILIYLLKNFDNPETPQVNQWLSRLAIWVVPQVNPDGNGIVWGSDNWWRKNARGDEHEIWGVDLNRNYPYMWGRCGGSSSDRTDQTFHGDKPASEPETQALMNLVKRENMIMNISYHSFSELVIPPYGCADRYTPEQGVVEHIGMGLANVLQRDDTRGTYTYGPAWKILYPVDGDDISWMYNEVNTLAYVIEVNSNKQGFQPDYEKWRNKTVAAQRKGWQFFLNRLLNGPQIRGQILDARSGQPVDAEIRIESSSYLDEKPRKAKGGVYYKMLAPGSWEVAFKAPGYQPQTLAFSVGSEGAVNQDVFMEPENR